MGDTEHLLLAERKGLSARLAYLEASLPLEADFALNGAEASFEHLSTRSLPLLLNQEERYREDNTLPLDGFLRKFERRMLGEMTSVLSSNHPVLLRKALPVVQGRINEISCHKCSPLKSVVCDGTRRDNQIVSEAGHCISSLRDMFTLARDTAIAYYSTHATLSTAPLMFPDILFSTRRYRGKPHDCPREYFTGGTTYYDERPPRKSRVVLDIDVDQFDASTYLVIPYVLFHECIAHALSALTPIVPERFVTRPDDRFGEGWMDWVAVRIFDEVLSRRSVSLLFPGESLARGRDFHFARLDHRQQPKSPNALKLSSGESAAKRVFDLMTKRPNLCRNPWHSHLKLSFDLNMRSDFSHSQRQDFVAKINLLAENEDLLNNYYPHHAQIAGYVVQYLIDGDLAAFINNTLNYDVY